MKSKLKAILYQIPFHLSDIFFKNIESMILWVPFIFATGILLYFSLPEEPSFFYSISLFITLVAGLFYFRKNFFSFLLLITFLLINLGFSVTSYRAQNLHAPIITNEIKYTEIVGRIVSITPLVNGTRVILEDLNIRKIAKDNTPRKVRLIVKTNMNGAQVGDLISTRATLMPLPEPTIPGGYDFELRFYFEGVGGLGYSLKDLTVITEEKRFFRNKISHLRTKIYAEIIKILGKKVGNIASALMIGEYTAIDAKILSDMRIAGISHILSVSGMHLSLVAAIFFFTTRIILCLLHRATYRLDAKKIAAVIAIIGSFAYLLISGLQIAAVRSFIMTAMVIFAIIIDRTATPMRSIAWAAFVILLFQPESIINPSFQMSFSAVIALIACFEYYQQLLPTAYNNKSIFSRILYYGASSIISSLVAGLATTPFIIYHFNQYSYYGVLSNLLAVPITSFIIMPCVILAFLFYPFGVMKWALIPMGYGISGLIYIADIIAKLPYAQKLTDTMPSLSLFIIVSGGLWLCLWRSKIRLVGLGIIACGLGLYFITPSPNIIIDSKSKVVAFITNNKIYFTSKKISKFSKEGILHSVGKEDFTVLDKNNLPSDISIKNGILYFKHNKHLVAIIDDKLNKQEQITVSNFSSCIDADLIINLTLLNALPCRVNPQHITLSNLTNNGSYKVFLGTSLIFENVVSSRGKRFWIR